MKPSEALAWETTQSNFPELRAQVGRILTELDGSQREQANSNPVGSAIKSAHEDK